VPFIDTTCGSPGAVHTAHRTWRSPRTIAGRSAWFWWRKQCNTCGASWDVAFEFSEACVLGPRGRLEVIEAVPHFALWRPATV
jgi:hypothetical protein